MVGKPWAFSSYLWSSGFWESNVIFSFFLTSVRTIINYVLRSLTNSIPQTKTSTFGTLDIDLKKSIIHCRKSLPSLFQYAVALRRASLLHFFSLFLVKHVRIWFISVLFPMVLFSNYVHVFLTCSFSIILWFTHCKLFPLFHGMFWELADYKNIAYAFPIIIKIAN